MFDLKVRTLLGLPAIYVVLLFCSLGLSAVAACAHHSCDVARSERMVLEREYAKSAHQVKKTLADCLRSQKIAREKARDEDLALHKALDAQKLAEAAIRLHADAQRDAIRKAAAVRLALEKKAALDRQAQEMAKSPGLSRARDDKEGGPIDLSVCASTAGKRTRLKMSRLVCKAERIIAPDNVP